jgi:hypothetical protein
MTNVKRQSSAGSNVSVGWRLNPLEQGKVTQCRGAHYCRGMFIMTIIRQSFGKFEIEHP